MVKLNESSSHRKLRNEIVRPSPKHLASAANAVGSNAVHRKQETADRASQTLSLTGYNSALNLEQSLPRFPALEESGATLFSKLMQ